jgi:hypothetical protein
VLGAPVQARDAADDPRGEQEHPRQAAEQAEGHHRTDADLGDAVVPIGGAFERAGRRVLPRHDLADLRAQEVHDRLPLPQ